MLQKIKEWFVSLPVDCQVELTYLNGHSLITGKYKDDRKNSLEAFLDFMESDGLNYQEILKRTLIIYSVIDMMIDLKLCVHSSIPGTLRELWLETDKSWTGLKKKELNIIDLMNFTIEYLT